jgi:hypothetical protein
LLLSGDDATAARAPAPRGSGSSSSIGDSSSSGSSSRSLLSFQWRPSPVDAEMAHFLKGLAIIAGRNDDETVISIHVM